LRKAITSALLPPALKQKLLQALSGVSERKPDVAPRGTLKELTGLPPSKALRALCVLFEIESARPPRWPTPNLSPEVVEFFVRTHPNPFDLLLESAPASLLELGAGDLSFAEALAGQYGAELERRDQHLILHCLDRLNPESKLGGPLHANPMRLRRLRSLPGIEFGFYGNQDMFDLQALDRAERLAAKYAIAACWAPATPTFAYEPSRLSTSTIEADLQATRGVSHRIHHEREAALEVMHEGRSLLFPPWKFDIRGPLALLQLMADRGALCVLGAVDSQVFWEILAQLVDDPRMRPADLVFTEDTLSEVFGATYRHLSKMTEGETCILSDLAPLRREFPPFLHASGVPTYYRFRHVRISRGAQVEGVPASSTASKFRHMSEESPPWFLVLVPESAAPSA
jgi:hypothetical protein